MKVLKWSAMIYASLFLTAAFTTKAHSFVSYVCTVKEISGLSGDGTIDTDRSHPFVMGSPSVLPPAQAEDYEIDGKFSGRTAPLAA